jgi:hypothetical protein
MITNNQDRTTEVNANDYLGRMEIYNAANLGLNQTYSVVAETEATPPTDVPMKHYAQYDAYTDRLVMTFDKEELSLLKYA